MGYYPTYISLIHLSARTDSYVADICISSAKYLQNIWYKLSVTIHITVADMLRGQIPICHRYVTDSFVHIFHRYFAELTQISVT